MNVIRLSIIVLFFLIALVESRHHHHKRVVDNDMEYRDLDDYSEYGLFVDAVPLKTTPHPKNLKHHKSNRLSKLRKYFSDNADAEFSQ